MADKRQPGGEAQESTGSEQTRGAAVWIIVERIRGAVLGNDFTTKTDAAAARRGNNLSGFAVHSLPLRE